jgi:hypothetical protein
VLSQIEEKLFKQSIYRPETDVTYYLSMVKGHAQLGSYVRYRVETSYTLHNAMSATVPYDVKIEIDVPADLTDNVRIASLRVQRESVDISQLVVMSDDGKFLKLKYPIDVPRGQDIVVEAVTESAGPVSSFDVFSCMSPCERLKLTCIFDETELEVVVFSTHPQEPTLDSKWEKRVSYSLMGVLPGQGLGLKWDPCRPGASSRPGG